MEERIFVFLCDDDPAHHLWIEFFTLFLIWFVKAFRILTKILWLLLRNLLWYAMQALLFSSCILQISRLQKVWVNLWFFLFSKRCNFGLNRIFFNLKEIFMSVACGGRENLVIILYLWEIATIGKFAYSFSFSGWHLLLACASSLLELILVDFYWFSSKN